MPSLTVFSNFPEFNDTKLHIPWTMDFSVNSGYMAVGNHKGNALLYRYVMVCCKHVPVVFINTGILPFLIGFCNVAAFRCLIWTFVRKTLVTLGLGTLRKFF